MTTNYDWQDRVLRVLIIAAGALSAILMVFEGHGHSLPALALGGTLGAFFVGSVGAAGD